MKRDLSLFLLCSALLLLCSACVTPDAPSDGARTTIRVITSLPGLSSEATESTITVPLEKVLADMQSLHEMRSRSGHGISTIWLQFKKDMPQDTLRLVKDRVTKATSSLPKDIEGPVVTLSTYPWAR